jgi:hypothetical protein
MSENTTAERFTERLMEHRSEEQKEQYRKSFKLGEGEYGEGEELVGVRMGQVFELANEFIEMAGMSEDANDVRGLDALAGEWSMEAVFPFDPPVTGRGRVSFEWLSEGSFLVQRGRSSTATPPTASRSLARKVRTEDIASITSTRAASRVCTR